MVNPDDLSLMNEVEKLDLLSRLNETDNWRESFDLIYRQLVSDDSPKVRAEAIGGLWSLADTRDIEPLMRVAESDPVVMVRAKAASVLGIFVYEAEVNENLDQAHYLAVRSFLLDLAQNPREELQVRRMAIEALSFDQDEVIQDLIDWAYRHADPEVRMSAVFAMGRSALPRWNDIILVELESPEPKLLIEAVNAAGEAGIAGATPVLRNLTRHTDKEVRLAAIWALSHTRGPGALETLEMCAQSNDEETRDVAEDALEEYNATGEEYDDSDYDDDSDDSH